jgi:DNA-binding response OmpR family regulator
MSKSILVLDDDPAFRELLVRVLEPSGFPVIEAGSVAEALELYSDAELVLAVVDLALPDENGGSFISRMREEGCTTPIVVVSATMLDQQMFTWLRNILHVSLMLQKPIDPSLFLQQIDSLLPGERPKAKPVEDISKQEYQQLVPATAGIKKGPPPPQEILDSGTWKAVKADPQHLQLVQEMQAKVQNELNIKAAQRELAKELPSEWETLAKRLLTLRHNLSDSYTRHLALSQAHKLKTSTATLGLLKVSDSAAHVEDYVKLLDANDPLSLEILWMEIFRSLADGESELRSVALPREEAGDEPMHAGEVLLLCGDSTLQKDTFRDKRSVEAKITFSISPVKVALSASSTRYDAAVLDVSTFGKQTVFALARELRGTDLNEGLPLAFVIAPESHLGEAERVFYGASDVINAPVDQLKFERCLRKLAGVNELKKVRILAVDDDPVLTRFLQTVLSVHGMSVTTLSDAIRILDTVEKVQPDIILLDVVMPGLSGYDICRLLRSSERWSDVPIIFLTSKSDAQGRAAAFQAGANDFLSKPVLTDELIARVQMQLQRAQFGRQRASADKVTGLFTQEAFMDRAADMQKAAADKSECMSLCLIEISNFDSLENYGLFSSITVLSQLGNLIKCRLPAETLRGRWGDNGFALAFQNEESQVVKDCAAMLLREIEQIIFAGDNGVGFSVRARTSVASYPTDALSFKALIDTVQGRMKAARTPR